VSGPTCPICSSHESLPYAEASDEEYFTTAEVFHYYRCPQCGVVFIDPMPIDRLAEIYPPNYYSFDSNVIHSPTFRIKDRLDRRFFAKLLRSIPGTELAALDVGGGVGWTLDTLKRSDARVDSTTVVDLDSDAGDEARRRGHMYHCARFEDFQPDRRFDFIILFNIIEHVADPSAVLDKVRELLAPGGLAVIKTPNMDSLDARLFHHRNWGGYHCPRHWVLFDAPAFQALAERSGLTVRQSRYTQGAPFWTTSVMYALHRKGWIQASSSRPIPTHPLYQLLNGVFAALDMVRGVFSRTSQMFFVLEGARDLTRPESVAEHPG
jgi:SAM-dependent methyltransferase